MRTILALMLFSLSMTAHAMKTGCPGITRDQKTSQDDEDEISPTFLVIEFPSSATATFEMRDRVMLDSERYGCITFIFNTEDLRKQNFINFDSQKMHVSLESYQIDDFSLGKIKEWDPETRRLIIELPKESTVDIKKSARIEGIAGIQADPVYYREMQVVIPGKGYDSHAEFSHGKYDLELTVSYEFLESSLGPVPYEDSPNATFARKGLLGFKFNNATPKTR